MICTCCFATTPRLSLSSGTRVRGAMQIYHQTVIYSTCPRHSIFWITHLLWDEEVPWKLFDFVICFQFPLSRQLEQQIKSFYHLHVSEWHRPHTQQTRSHPTLCLSWHESGWQRTRQTLTRRECVWGHRRSRRSCCVKHHTASWQGAPSSEQCSLRLAALWTGFTRRELRLVGSAHTVPTLSSKAPRY